jgi:parallel beta-helix repeat protein
LFALLKWVAFTVSSQSSALYQSKQLLRRSTFLEMSSMIPSFLKLKNDMHLASERREERLRRQRSKAKRRSLLEKLEDRRLLATLLVTNGNDSGDGSLRAAIESANNNNQADTITFAEAVSTVSLQKTLHLRGNGQDDNTIIKGPVKITLVKGGGDDSGDVIEVDPGAFAELSKVEISGSNRGRAIANFSNLILRDSTLHGNRDENNLGAAIYTNDRLQVVNSTISNNFARLGGGVYVSSGTAVFVNSTVTNNQATENGGGIWIGRDGNVTIRNSIIAGNFNNDSPNDFEGNVNLSSTYNLVGDADSAGGLTNSNNNIVGVNGSGVRDVSTVIDTTLRINGGRTPTHALVADSPAIDAGDNTLFTSSVGRPAGPTQNPGR